MVVFDRLEITEGGKVLTIEAHVNKASYFDNIRIDKVYVLTQDQVSEMNPTNISESYIYKLVIANDTTRDINLSLRSNTDFEKIFSTLSDQLLFVYIVCKEVGTGISIDTPCRLDEKTTLGVTFDTHELYKNVLNLSKELRDTCEIPRNFIDLILLWNGFKAAISTEHYIEAKSFWNRMFNAKYNSNFVSKPCGCHG